MTVLHVLTGCRDRVLVALAVWDVNSTDPEITHGSLQLHRARNATS